MFLALDIGNTQTTYGLIAEKPREVVKRWRTQTSSLDTADELAVRLKELFDCSDFSLEDVCSVGISCVVPALFHAWKTAIERLGKTPFIIQATDFLDTGLIAKDIAAPETIGGDRLANAAEALRTYGSPAIVVDFGTATNIDVVNAEGAFIGGSISPGLMLSANALFKNAGMLADVPIMLPRHAIGRTSEENLQAGFVLGWAGMVEKLVSCMKDELHKEGGEGRECAVIGTGGLMSIMSEATDCFTALDSDLTLRGIYYLHQLKNEDE